MIYCLDHGIKIERNKKSFRYNLDGVERSYFPDFVINGSTYVEIKGYYDNKTQEKEKQFPKEESLLILKKSEMEPILAYVKTKYGPNFVDLYDISFVHTVYKD